ncbi:MAG: hypothetical protein Ct9H300mP28_17180 [Pseudomonadota bacterium]|nr:MAG: hypothetical protein Ct9H300mP28_17180 [Pseudomonadota bacterium]
MVRSFSGRTAIRLYRTHYDRLCYNPNLTMLINLLLKPQIEIDLGGADHIINCFGRFEEYIQ